MPQPTKVFRVFVSSTFTDMKEERRILQKNVFPKLEQFCNENGAKFQAVDLRWGVSEESSLNQKTLDICLNEIDRCQRISPKPNFLVLLGDKYGWQPIPTKIPKDEMDAIITELNDDGKELLKTWYQLDTNAIPAEHVLQPRGEAYKAYSEWGKVEEEIKNVLREAVKQLNFSTGKQNKYFTSATHQEILAGALHDDDTLEKPDSHVLTLSRNIKGLPMDESASGYLDITDGKPDEYCQEQLKSLRTELDEKLEGHYIPYQATWDKKESKSNIDNPDEFENTVFDFLKNIIDEQIKQVISPDEIEHERKLHKEFKEKLTEHFCGRKEILQTLNSYLKTNPDKKALAMIGESGSGKSSVMAKAAEETEKELQNATVVYRFIGATSSSSNIISLLQSISGQIAKGHDTTIEKLAGEGNEKNLHDINGISEVFRKAVNLGTAEKPLVIFLDALDQLNDSDNAKALYWLPTELPENTRIIISSLPELEAPLNNQQIENLPVLPVQEAEQILSRWLEAVNRTLTNQQQQEVLNKFNHTQLPIYLKLAYEMAKHWNSYTTEYTLKEDVKGIINSFIDSLHNEHNKEFVQDVICLMLCGRYKGLAENEILEIFAFDENGKDGLWDKFLKTSHSEHIQELKDMKKELNGSMKIPIVVWSRLFLDLEPFLTERDADGVPIITFFHRQFNEVLAERYGLSEVEETN